MKKIIFIIFISCLFISCQKSTFPKEVETALSFAGENKKELIKVINFYNKKESDSLKLKAAYYLISNMMYHRHIDKTILYEDAFVKAKKARDFFQQTEKNYTVHDLKNYTNKIFKNVLDSINKSPNFKDHNDYFYDVKNINASFLIDNIEIAFEAYENNPLKLCKNFEDFLRYVLPYRVGDEPLEKRKRKELFNKYKWVHDSLKTLSLEKIIEKIFIDVSIQAVWGNTNHYSNTQSLTQIEHTRFGTCTEAGIYFTNLFRAIGIPSGIDYCPRLGTWHKSEGHSWIFYLTENGFESINVALDRFEKLKELYKISDIPKVYRESFDKIPLEEKDVTNLYRNTYDIDLKVLWHDGDPLSADNLFLSVFDYDIGWDKIVKALSVINDSVQFKNVGNNLIYMPMVNKNGKLIPFNYPFRLEKDGEVKFFNLDDEKIKDAVLVRKFMPFLIRARKEKVRWARSLSGCVLQGANVNSPEEFKDLYTIKNFNSGNNVSYKIDKEVCYRFFRLKGPAGQSINLANFKLVDKENQTIEKWQEVKLAEDEKDLVNNITDSDPLTYIDKNNMVLTYDLGKPGCISGFQIQARNDDNNIRIGDEYELFYWDKEWNSLGSKQANDTMLVYQDIPKNPLYWLRNLTRGKEEFVFTFDNDGKQFWTGISEYEDLDSIMLK